MENTLFLTPSFTVQSGSGRPRAAFCRKWNKLVVFWYNYLDFFDYF